jgi:hypothetical protein
MGQLVFIGWRNSHTWHTRLSHPQGSYHRKPSCAPVLSSFQSFLPTSSIFSSYIKFIDATVYYLTSGFWARVRARALRARVFLGSLPRPTWRCAPPRPSQLRCSPKTPKWKNKLIPETKCLPSLGLAAPYWATLHPTELRCTLLSYAAP